MLTALGAIIAFLMGTMGRSLTKMATDISDIKVLMGKHEVRANDHDKDILVNQKKIARIEKDITGIRETIAEIRASNRN